MKNKKNEKPKFQHTNKKQFYLSPEIIFGFENLKTITSADMKSIRNFDKSRST